MDEEHTAGFREACAQCSAVDWGVSDEGRFYCRSCHNVIERTKEVVDPTVFLGANRISRVARGPRVKTSSGRGLTWTQCEGFQWILRNQADALLRLGVHAHFKDAVLCPLWRRYLQTSQQAYTSTPVTRSRSRSRSRGRDEDSDSDVDRGPESLVSGPISESCSDWSESGDASSQLTLQDRRGRGRRRGRGLMTMTKTLALVHLALVWSREALTLSDLLRLVREGHVPYVNAYQDFPEEMKLISEDALVFRVESVPPQHVVHRDARSLAVSMQLPAFPPIRRSSLLHPQLLSLRFLREANLPDQLHPWFCLLLDRTGLGDEGSLTFDPGSRPVLPQYEVQTAALILVTMKLLFGLDDHTEWDLSNEAGCHDDSGPVFSLRRWYRLVQAALTGAEQRRRRDAARRQWTAEKPIVLGKDDKSRAMKKKRIAAQVQTCFERLSSCPVGVGDVGPSSFTFLWGDEDGADGPSLHHLELDAVLVRDGDVLVPSNPSYWHPVLRPCKARSCRSHFEEVEPSLPRSFLWLLHLFSFLLDVKTSRLYEEVLGVERRLLGHETSSPDTPLKKRRRRRRRKSGRGQEPQTDSESDE